MTNFEYTSENEIKFQEYVTRYPKIDSCMLPALWLVQEQIGWVSPESMVYVAVDRDAWHAAVHGVAKSGTRLSD